MTIRVCQWGRNSWTTSWRHTCITSTNLLEKLAGYAEHHTAEMLAFATGEEGTIWRVASHVARSADAVEDDARLELDFVIVTVLPGEGS